MNQKLINDVVAKYDEDDAKFAQWAHKKIAEHFDSMKPSQSKTDPTRMGTKSVLYSKIKQACLEKAGPLEVEGVAGMKEFNGMTIKEQLKFQARARLDGPKWAVNLGIMPENLRNFVLPEKEKLTVARAKIDTDKLRADMEEIDGDRLMEKLMPGLLGGKRHHQAAAVMLATGRRTTEVLMSGDIYLSNNNTMDGYRCMFSGQLKAGLDDKPYEIPLLAPYAAVKAAWDRIRELYPTQGMTTDEVNSAYAGSISNFTQRAVGLKPHGLRAAYALMTFQGQKSSLIGHIGKVLGHAQSSAAAYYQRAKIINYSGPWKVKVETPDHEWELEGAAELKRLSGLLEMQEQRIPITATAIRTHAGGTMKVCARIVEKNEKLISLYNASLEK